MIDSAMEDAMYPPYLPTSVAQANFSDDEQPSSDYDDFDLSDHSVYPDRPRPATPVKRELDEPTRATIDKQFVTPTSTRSESKLKYLNVYAANWKVVSPKNQSSRTGRVH